VVQLALSSMVLDVNNALGESFTRMAMSVTRLRAFVNAERGVNAGGRTFKMTSQSQYRLFGRVLRRMRVSARGMPWLPFLECGGAGTLIHVETRRLRPFDGRRTTLAYRLYHHCSVLPIFHCL